MTERGRERSAGVGRPLATAALATYGTNVGAAVLSLVNVLIVARVLGPVGRGDVAFLIAVATITSHLAAFGVQEANANIGGSEASRRPGLATNSVLLATLFGGLAAAATAATVAVFPSVGGEIERALLWFALLAVPVVVLKTYLTFLVQAEYAFSVTNLAWIAGPSTTFVANAILAVAGSLSVGTAIAAWVGGQTLGAAILITYVRRRGGFGVPDLALSLRSLRFGIKVHVGRFMAVGNYRIDQWFLGAISGSRELGLYSVAVAWAEILFYVPGVLVMIQRPRLVRASPEEAARLAARVFRVALLLALAAATFLIVAAPVLCTAIFGDAFRGAADDLRVLALAAFGIVALELLGSALTAQRRPLRATAAIGVAFAATIALDLALIPAHGGVGAAIATSAAWTLGGLVVALLFTRALSTRVAHLVPSGTDVGWLWRAVREPLSRAPRP